MKINMMIRVTLLLLLFGGRLFAKRNLPAGDRRRPRWRHQGLPANYANGQRVAIERCPSRVPAWPLSAEERPARRSGPHISETDEGISGTDRVDRQDTTVSFPPKLYVL